ncbi:PEP-CTERM sorting domain-containing protein [Cephaloticoccus capnophilus]
MVPEPSTYGAVLLGLGLGVVVLKRRRVKKGRRGSVLGSVPVSNVSAR